jgi:hypothetical protein
MTRVCRFGITFEVSTGHAANKVFLCDRTTLASLKMDFFELAYGLASLPGKHVASPYKKKTREKIHRTIRSPSLSD